MMLFVFIFVLVCHIGLLNPDLTASVKTSFQDTLKGLFTNSSKRDSISVFKPRRRCMSDLLFWSMRSCSINSPSSMFSWQISRIKSAYNLFFIFCRAPLLLLACQKELPIIGRADTVHAAKDPTQLLALLVAAGLRDARD